MQYLIKNNLLLLLFFTITAIIPITSYSLWIDESSTAFFASQNTFNELNTTLLSASSSEIQMPGYIYYMWAWVKIFGHNEFILRLSNLPFIILLLLVLFNAPFTGRLKIIFATLVVFSPFVWYNLNEARCTIPVFSLGAIAIISLAQYFEGTGRFKKKAIWMFSASVVLGVVFNMLFLLFIPIIALLFLSQIIHYRIKFRKIFSDWLMGFIVMLISIVLLAFYYFWTIDQGKGGFKETPGIMNLVFLLYEHLGFSGIGPPRNILRESFSLEVVKPYLPFLVLFTLFYLLLFVYIFKYYRKHNKVVHIIFDSYLITYIFGVIFFSIVCFIFDFRFLGRHGAFLLPIFLFFLAKVIDDIINVQATIWLKILILLLFSFTLISDINTRFKSAYKKENNREAALMAIKSADVDGAIIWNGFERLAAYYGLDIY